MRQERRGDYSPSNDNRSNAVIHDRTGLYLAIIAFGIACVCAGYTISVKEKYDEMKTHVLLMDDAFQRWKMFAETHGFPGPEQRK